MNSCSTISINMILMVVLALRLSHAPVTAVASSIELQSTIASVRQSRLQHIASVSHTSRSLQGSSTNDTCAVLIGALELSTAGANACNCSLEESTGIYTLECNYDYCQDCLNESGACAVLSENSTYKYENNELTYVTFHFCAEFSGSLTQTLCYSDQKDDAVCSISVGNGASQTVCNYCLFISCPEDSVLPTNFLKEFSFDCSNLVINGGPGPTVTYCQATNDDLTGVFGALATDQYTFDTCFAEQSNSSSSSNVSVTTPAPVGANKSSNATNTIPTPSPGGDAPSAAPDSDSLRCANFINGLSLAPAGTNACTCTPNGVGKFYLVSCNYSYCEDCNPAINSCGTLLEQYVYNRNNRRVSYTSCVNMTGDVQGQICYSERYDTNVCTMTIGPDGKKKECNSCTTNVNCTNGNSIPNDFFQPFSFDCTNLLSGVNVDACSSTNETLVPNTILAGLRNDIFTFPYCWGSGAPTPTTPAPLAPSSSTAPSSAPALDAGTPSPSGDEVAQVCSMLIGKLDLAPEGANACQCYATNKAQTFFAVECDFSYCPEFNQELNTSATLARRYTFNYKGRQGSFTNCVNMTGGIMDTVCYSELFKSDDCAISIGVGNTSKECTSCTNDVNCRKGPDFFLAPVSFDCSNLISGLTADYCTATNDTLSGISSIEVALRNDVFTFASCFGGGGDSTPSPAPATTAMPTPLQSSGAGPTAPPQSEEQVCEGLISELALPPEGTDVCSCTPDGAGKAFTLDCDFDYCQDCNETVGICGNLTETRVFSRAGDYISNSFCVALTGTVEGAVCYGDSIDSSACNITIDTGSGPVQCNSCYAVQCNPGAQPPTNFFKPVSFDCSNVLPSLVFDYCTATDETLSTDSVMVALRNDTLSFVSCFEANSQPQSTYPQSSYPSSSNAPSTYEPSTFQPSSSSAPAPSVSSSVPTLSDIDACKALVAEQLLPPSAEGSCTCEPTSSIDVFVVNCNYDYCEQCVTQPNVCGGFSESIQYTRAGKYISSGYCVDLSGDTSAKVCVSDNPDDANQCTITVTTNGTIQDCTSCQYVQCNLGSTAMSIDCSNIVDGAIANFCVGSELLGLDATSPMLAFRSDLLSFNSCFSNEDSKNPGPTPPPTSVPPTSVSGNTDNSGAKPRNVIWSALFAVLLPAFVSRSLCFWM